MKASLGLQQICLMVFIVLLTNSAIAVSSDSFGDDFDDEEPALQLASSGVRRDYPGVRDEKGLEVQTALPVPTRSPEAAAQIRPVADEDGEGAHD